MNRLGKYVDIIEMACEYQEPGKKTIQKLFYLIERKGVDLDLNYRIHFFGPYSSKLDDALHLMESYDFININTHGKTHVISVLNTEDIEYEGLNSDEREIASFIIDTFKGKTPLELEAMTTLDYIANSIGEVNALKDGEIINEVMRIKGKKFTREELQKEIEILRKYEFI